MMRNLKRLATLFLSAALSLTLALPVFAAESDTGFEDVDASAWFAQEAVWCRDNGVMNGTSDSTFSPDRTMTRGMLANARPAISEGVENMEDYDIIFLGYPIWWGDAPRIISTFLESYDFSGRTIIPFCTSGSSGIGSSASDLEALTEGATWLDGQRFSGNASEATVESWVNGLDMELPMAA